MSLANIFAGIGGAYQAIQKGMDDAQARKDADQQRKWREEDRVWQEEQRGAVRADRTFQDEQRGIWRTEQKRKDDELQRADRIRKEDADAYGQLGKEVDAAPATTTAPAPKLPAAPSISPGQEGDKITPPNPALGNKGVASVQNATLLPGSISETPVAQTLPANPAEPAAVQPLSATAPAATTPAATAPAATEPRRKITYADVLRSMAKSRAKEGMAADAMKFTEEATKWDLDQANSRLTALIGGVDTMSLEEYANSAKTLFNSDPLPQSITDVKVNRDNTVTVTIKHNDNGAQTTRTFKDKNELTSTLQSFYQKEAFNKRLQAASDAALKISENPITTVPGGYYDKKNNKFVPTMVGGDIIGYGKDGEPIYSSKGPGAGASGASGASKKATTPADAYTGYLDDAIKTSEVKLGSPDEAIGLRDAVSKLAQGANYDQAKLPPGVAAKVGLNYLRAGGMKAEKAGIDPVTGVPRREFTDPEYGVFTMGPVVGPAQQAEALKAVPVMLERQGLDASGKPQEKLAKSADGNIVSAPQSMEDVAAYQKKLRAAAFDKSGPNGTSVLRRELEEDVRAQVELSAQQAIAKYPDKADQIKAAIPGQVNGQIAILGRKLDWISKGMKPEKVEEKDAPPKTLSQRLAESGSGLPAGLRTEAQRVAEEQKNRDAAKLAQQNAESKAAQDRAVENKKLREEAAAIPPEAISRSNNLNELIETKKKYDRFMNGFQRTELDRRIGYLKRQFMLANQ